MSRLTSLRVGGPADAVVTPATPQEAGAAAQWARGRGVPLLVMGAGSNLLVRDGGIRGLVLRIGPPMDRWGAEAHGQDVRIWAWAGLPLRRLVREGMGRGWGGVEAVAGIPGNLGGAVAMNAGTDRGAVGELIHSVTWIRPGEGPRCVGRAALRFSYRCMERPPGSIIVAAQLRFFPDAPATVREAVRGAVLRRLERQPHGMPSAGSVFRNPEGDWAGRLIEAAGCKGLQCGGAEVSRRHANFIVNRGGATARDVLALIQEVRERVVRHAGRLLELEVQVVGEEP
jgi:UDP-N-acetylmuramate dehydrogenase